MEDQRRDDKETGDENDDDNEEEEFLPGFTTFQDYSKVWHTMVLVLKHRY